MINLENFVGTEKQQAVLNKYGWNTIERLVNRAWLNYWRVIKETIDIQSSTDGQYPDIQNELLIAILDYIYKNDYQIRLTFNDVIGD